METHDPIYVFWPSILCPQCISYYSRCDGRDDIVVAHHVLGVVKHATAIVDTIPRWKGLEIIARKIQAMKFWRGGRLSTSNITRCGGQPSKLVKVFPHLSLRIHYTDERCWDGSTFQLGLIIQETRQCAAASVTVIERFESLFSGQFRT